MAPVKSIDYHGLPKTTLVDLKSRRLYYSKVVAGMRSRAQIIEFEPLKWIDFQEIPNDLSDLRRGLETLRENKGFARIVLNPDGVIYKEIPLTIPIDRRSYFAFELDPAVDWEFDLGFLGVTAKKFYNDSNGYIRYFDEDLNEIEVRMADYRFGMPLSDRRCTLVLFAISRLNKGSAQGFNLHTLLGPREKAVPTLFDPDIKNDGDGFDPDTPPPPPPPHP